MTRTIITWHLALTFPGGASFLEVLGRVSNEIGNYITNKLRNSYFTSVCVCVSVHNIVMETKIAPSFCLRRGFNLTGNKIPSLKKITTRDKKLEVSWGTWVVQSV